MKKIEGWVTAPQGFLAAGVKAGIKASGNHDVAVIYSTVPAAAGAVFTQNKMCAAPVLISREVAQEAAAQAIIVNSGCANACTGEQGLLDAKEMQTFAAGLLGIEPQQVYVCSTGVIGHFLPMDKINPVGRMPLTLWMKQKAKAAQWRSRQQIPLLSGRLMSLRLAARLPKLPVSPRERG